MKQYQFCTLLGTVWIAPIEPTELINALAATLFLGAALYLSLVDRDV